MIGKCVAAQCKATFFSISASSLTSKWVGEGEKMVRVLFAVARVHAPSLIFIDEIDSLLSQRSESEHESSRRIKTEFLVQLDGVTSTTEERILLIGATNRPQELDEAARRRFVKRLYVPLPCEKGRRDIIKTLMQAHSQTVTEEECDVIVGQTQGYSGADMANLCKEASMGPLRELSMETIETMSAKDIRPISMSDFLEAISHVRPSVSPNDLFQYKEWNEKFGSFQIENL